ncbi:phosphate ABC transporter permease subunit PstC [Croceicoccus estronivorus]|uniref:phosphate ABC transporter permease subunit PstC n=1 Tax=Croceicoccus estronivorus TaxID=1172626 RepID=UPI00082CC57E|nr:phosphate ABC transporter permease subunit PstC [Croceicoccus estronivorus]OCC25032.1 phosphate ABC transporter permease subunit PstC [Croceicoccus estronivorus]
MAEADLTLPGNPAPRSMPPRGLLPTRRNDTLFQVVCFSAAMVLMAALFGLILSLAWGGWPAFERFGIGFLFSSEWNPVTDEYGAAGPIVGTLVTAFLSLLLALPLAVGVAIFLVEFCPQRIAHWLAIAVELLAGIPSIVYGMWGLFVLAPWFADHIQLPLLMSVEPGSWLDTLFSGVPNGANIFTASLILAIMILPYMATVFRELLISVPPQMREAAYGIGCTSFEVVGSIMLPYIRRSAVGAVMLGLGRALGETMAVTFIIGNSHGFPKSLFASGSTIASTIANEFTEATGDLHIAALIALGFVLFLITFASIAGARLLLGAERYR